MFQTPETLAQSLPQILDPQTLEFPKKLFFLEIRAKKSFIWDGLASYRAISYKR